MLFTKEGHWWKAHETSINVHSSHKSHVLFSLSTPVCRVSSLIPRCRKLLRGRLNSFFQEIFLYLEDRLRLFPFTHNLLSTPSFGLRKLCIIAMWAVPSHLPLLGMAYRKLGHPPGCFFLGPGTEKVLKWYLQINHCSWYSHEKKYSKDTINNNPLVDELKVASHFSSSLPASFPAPSLLSGTPLHRIRDS